MWQDDGAFRSCCDGVGKPVGQRIGHLDIPEGMNFLPPDRFAGRDTSGFIGKDKRRVCPLYSRDFGTCKQPVRFCGILYPAGKFNRQKSRWLLHRGGFQQDFPYGLFRRRTQAGVRHHLQQGSDQNFVGRLVPADDNPITAHGQLPR